MRRTTVLAAGLFICGQAVAACRPAVGGASSSASFRQASTGLHHGSERRLVSQNFSAPPNADDEASEPSSAPMMASESAAPPEASQESACNPQAAQPFLVRSSYAFDPTDSKEITARKKTLHQKAVEYRTRRYGYVDGFGEASWNAHEPDHYARGAKFFGIPVRMNARVLVALGCVETEIVSVCSETPYQPHNLDSIRFRNTFHNAEITNHAYGIALDLDWDTNPCCGCVAPLNHAPKCSDPTTTAFERTDIPRCWIETFEKYGFYWLGHDQLQDTMHFEFLGDPSKILRAPDGVGSDDKPKAR